MKQLTANVYVETGLRGSNHGFVTTSDGLVLIDGPFKPSDALRLRAELERRGRLRYLINTEPHGDHWTANAFFDVPVIAHEGVRTRILATDMAVDNVHVKPPSATDHTVNSAPGVRVFRAEALSKPADELPTGPAAVL